jgi:hypothetical protein
VFDAFLDANLSPLRLKTLYHRPKTVVPAAQPLAFTVAPHLQTINYRVCFSPFAGIWSVLATPHQG